MDNPIVVCSFDIGEKNFALTKSQFNILALQKLAPLNIPLQKRYNQNKECTPEFASFLDKLSLLGKCIYANKLDITKEGDKRYGNRLVITNKVLVRLSNYLEDLNEQKVFDDVTYFVIEEQLKKAKNNQILQYHLRSYLLLLFLNTKPIILFPSKYKTQILGAPKITYNKKKKCNMKMNHLYRKKWASEKAFNILTARKDNDTLSKFFGKKKKSDDISDCILETESFIYMLFIDGKKYLLEN